VITEIRGTALILGLKLDVPNTTFTAAARDELLLVIPAGDNVVRLLPPLIISEADVAEAVKRIDATAGRLQVQMRGAAE
ncbi:MAG: aminotransferase class III-fold pyridoxal phosphate-dependent enzyme, partial [Methylobacterium sp.]